MSDIKMLEVHVALHTFEASRKILREFKDGLNHGDIAVIKGVHYPVWKFHELWDDWDDSILVFNRDAADGLWRGMERIRIEQVESVIPKEEAKK